MSLLRRTSSGFIAVQSSSDDRSQSIEDEKERRRIQTDISMYTLWNSIVWMGAPFNNKSSWLTSTLHWAAESGKADVLTWLAERGVDMNTPDTKTREIALHKAARYKHPVVVKWLLDHGSDVNARDKYGNTALHNAAYYGQLENLFYLISFRANVNVINDNKETVLHKIALHGSSGKDTDITMLDCLIQSRIRVNCVDKNGESALHVAARTRKYDVFTYLVQRGGNVHIKNVYGETPLHVHALVKDNWTAGSRLNIGKSTRSLTRPLLNLQ